MATHLLRGLVVFAIPLLALLSAPATAEAHRDDYLDETLVYLTLQHHELELEYWFDWAQAFAPPNDVLRHNVAVEYGISGHWMVDARATGEQESGSAFVFESARLESRYRFSEEGKHALDIAVSGEVKTRREENGALEFALEPRLILSKDLGKLNLTLNLAEEIPLETGKPSFTPAFGFRHNTGRLLRLGSELKYDTEVHGGSVIPQIWLALPHGLTIKFGYSFRFGRNPIRFGRLAFEGEL